MSDPRPPAGSLPADAAAGVRRAQPRPARADRRDRHRSLWANARFAAATGYAGRRGDDACSTSRSRGAPGSEARLSFARMLSSPGADSGVLQLRGPAGERVLGRRAIRRASAAASSGRSPTSRDQRALAARARAPGRAARHRAGVRPARHLGARRSRPAKAAGTSTCSASGASIRPSRNAALRRRDRAHPSRGPRAHDLRRVDAARRPLRAALPRHPARRQDALDPLAVGGEERPARHSRPRPRRHDGRHRGLRGGARAERRQRAAQARRRPRQDRDLAPRPAHRPHALQRPSASSCSAWRRVPKACRSTRCAR